MQDKYAGDIGDFGKFVFLHALHRASGGRLRLGINWYKTTRPERSSNDGRHVSYLDPAHPNKDAFRQCDPEIYDSLARIVRGTRSVNALEKHHLAPTGTLFYSAPIPFGHLRQHLNVSGREAWFSDSLACLRAANVLFLDPDNGIASPALRDTEARAMKYVFLDEMRQYYDRCEMLIVYHHRDRSPAARYRQKFMEARQAVDPSATMRILRFKRVSVRDYIFLYRSEAAPVVNALFEKMAAAPFYFLFEELRLE